MSELQEENGYDIVVCDYHHGNAAEPKFKNVDGYCTPLSEPVVPTNGLCPHDCSSNDLHHQLISNNDEPRENIYESTNNVFCSRESVGSADDFYPHVGPSNIKAVLNNDLSAIIYESAIDSCYDNLAIENDYAVVDKTKKSSHHPGNYPEKSNLQRDEYAVIDRTSKNSHQPQVSTITDVSANNYVSLKNLIKTKHKNVRVLMMKREGVVQWVVYGLLVLLLIAVCCMGYTSYKLKEEMKWNKRAVSKTLLALFIN